MSAQITLVDGRLVVSGDLDFVTVVSLLAQSLPLLAECKALQFDLSQVTSSNSGGLALLLEWIKYAKRSAKPISFVNTPQKLMQIAVAAGINTLLIK